MQVVLASLVAAHVRPSSRLLVLLADAVALHKAWTVCVLSTSLARFMIQFA